MYPTEQVYVAICPMASPSDETLPLAGFGNGSHAVKKLHMYIKSFVPRQQSSKGNI